MLESRQITNPQLDTPQSCYQRFFKAAPISTLVLNQNGLIIEANHSATKLFGSDSETLQGIEFATLIQHADRERYHHSFLQSLKTRQPCACEIQMFDHAGNKYWMNLELTVTQGSEADSLENLITLSDITQLKHYKETAEQFQRILSVTPDRIAFVDTSYKYITVSESYFSSFGKTREQIVGHSISELFGESFFKQIQKPKLDKCLAGETVRFQFWRSYLDLEHSYTDVHLTPVKNTSSEVIGIVINSRDITSRKRTEEALANSEQRHRTLLANLPVGVFRISSNGQFESVNRTFMTILGYGAEEEILGLVLDTVFNRTGQQSLFERIQNRGWIKNYEIDVQCKNGTSIPVSLSIRAVTDKQDVILHWNGIIEDISERRDTEAKLRLAATAFECIDAIVILDPQGKVLRVNHAFNDLTGYPDNDIIGKNLVLLRSDYHDAAFYQALIKTLADRGAWQGEVWYRHQSGDIRPVWFSIRAVTGQQGGTTNYVANFRSLESEKRLEGITENLPGIIFRCIRNLDGDLKYPYISAGTEDVLGYNTEQLLEGPSVLFRATHAEDTERVRNEWDKSAQQLTAINIEYRVIARGGEYRWVREIARPHRLVSGEVAWDGYLMDITEFKTAAQERSQLAAQLSQAQKLESIGQLAAGVAHEINTPTQYVGDNVRYLKDTFDELLGLTQRFNEFLEAARAEMITPELIKKTSAAVEDADLEFLAEETPKAIGETLDGVNRIATIVGAMKAFSHPGGKDPEVVDINAVIQNTITVARNEWKYVAEMSTDLESPLPQLLGFPGELGQVFLNLIVNGAHAIGEVVADSGTTGTISISSKKLQDHIEIRIQDTGGGIPEAARDKIFEPFFTTKELGKGTGQGLAIAHSVITKKHQGSLRFETECGKGTTFIIHLPVVVDLKKTEART